MKRSILFLALILIAGCKSSVEPDEPIVEEVEYPFIEQAWQVESGERATYIGVRAKSISSTDTIFIDKPEKFNLEIQEGFMEGLFSLKFTDSTRTNLNYDSDEIGHPKPDSLFGHSYQSMYVTFTKDYSVIRLRYPFLCGKEYEPEEFAYINWKSYSDTTKTVRVYAIAVSGALETIHHIVCQN